MPATIVTSCLNQSNQNQFDPRGGWHKERGYTNVIIDCARMPPQGHAGMSNDTWWLNLYVMFSRATKMSDMLLIRSPPRNLLERGPPTSVHAQL